MTVNDRKCRLRDTSLLASICPSDLRVLFSSLTMRLHAPALLRLLHLLWLLFHCISFNFLLAGRKETVRYRNLILLHYSDLSAKQTATCVAR